MCKRNQESVSEKLNINEQGDALASHPSFELYYYCY